MSVTIGSLLGPAGQASSGTASLMRRSVSSRYSSNRPKRILCLQLPQGVKVEGQVVDGHQGGRRHLPRHVQVAEVGAAHGAAGVAGALGVGRARVGAVAGVADGQPAPRGEQLAVARVAGGQHAVEHVDAARDAFDEVLRRADAHQVARPVRGQDGIEADRARGACPPWARPPRARRSRSPGKSSATISAALRSRRSRWTPALHDPEQPLVGRAVCASRLRRAQRVVRAVASSTASRGAGCGGHSSKAMTMSAPRFIWISIERSGVSRCGDPSRWLWKRTPSSVRRRSLARLKTW